MNPTFIARGLKQSIIRNCSVERTLDIVSDVWTFLVLREIYLGSRRFDQIHDVLRAPRTTMSNRLNCLVEKGVLWREQYSSSPPRYEYRLTDMGYDLYLVMLSFLRFGDDWLCNGAPPPAELVHTECGHCCHPTTLCSGCGEEIDARDVSYRDGPGAGVTKAGLRPQRRRGQNSSQFEGARPSSVSRVLNIIGDRWTFLVLREAFFGVRRFEKIQENLGIASNILTDRLGRLVQSGVFARQKYHDGPARFEYCLTQMGRELYLPMIEMLRFGDCWLGTTPPLILTHRTCGQDFLPVLSCDFCRKPLNAREMRFRLNYDLAMTSGRVNPAQIF